MQPKLLCLFCVHKINIDFKEISTCKAFPNGIPETILMAKESHVIPILGDNGIVFIPEKGFEYLLIEEQKE